MENNKHHMELDDTYDVLLVELSLEVFDELTTGGEVGRHDDVGPVPRPLHSRGMQQGPAPSGAARIGAGERRRQGPASRGAAIDWNRRR
jgi:hypothetical protein